MMVIAAVAVDKVVGGNNERGVGLLVVVPVVSNEF